MCLVAGAGASARTTFALRGASAARLPSAATSSGFASSEPRLNREESYLPKYFRSRVSWRGLELPPILPSLCKAQLRRAFRPRQHLRVSYLQNKGCIMKNPIFQRSSDHVYRGGYWHNAPRGLRSAWRFSGTASLRSNHVGFRIFRTKVGS